LRPYDEPYEPYSDSPFLVYELLSVVRDHGGVVEPGGDAFYF
jgi:hypothetical protein